MSFSPVADSVAEILNQVDYSERLFVSLQKLWTVFGRFVMVTRVGGKSSQIDRAGLNAAVVDL